MLRKKKYIIFALTALAIIVIATIYYLWENSPNKMIESKFQLKLPASAVVLNYEYHRNSDYLGAKILLDEKDLKYINEALHRYFKKEYSLKYEGDIPNFKSVLSWWDLDKSNIINCYNVTVGSDESWFKSLPKSIYVWAFITRDSENHYYLYLIY